MRRPLLRTLSLAAPLFLAAAPILSSGCVAPVFGEKCLPSEDNAPEAACGSFVKFGTSGGNGSPDRPYTSITQAISIGAKVIYICGEAADSQGIEVPGGTQLVGGLDCESWAVDAALRTKITAPAGTIPARFKGGGPIVVEGMAFVAVDAVDAGASSIAVIADEADVTFRRVQFTAANGASGTAGAMGASGEPSQAGLNATSAAGAAGGASTCGSDGGDGGDGSGTPTAGDPGMPNQDNAGLPGCSPGGPGTEGAVGATGAHASGNGTLSSEGFAPASATNGDAGMPGGGGGGGGAIASNGGGGGGAGGCPGGGGGAGQSGGSSIAIVSFLSQLRFEDCNANVGTAGNGGLGGPGGAASAGRAPGGGSQAACDGGMGADGGDGGPGGNGAGGHALVVAFTGDSIDVEGISHPELSGVAGEGPGDAVEGTARDVLALDAAAPP